MPNVHAAILNFHILDQSLLFFSCPGWSVLWFLLQSLWKYWVIKLAISLLASVFIPNIFDSLLEQTQEILLGWFLFLIFKLNCSLLWLLRVRFRLNHKLNIECKPLRKNTVKERLLAFYWGRQLLDGEERIVSFIWRVRNIFLDDLGSFFAS